MGLLTSILGPVGALIKGIFGLKQAQADAVTQAVSVVAGVTDADQNYAMAAAKAIEAVYSSGPPVERLWRPVAMWIFLGLIVARFFGYVPVGLDETEIANVYNFFEIGLIGYLPLRSMDKWMKGFQIGSLLKEFIAKKVL